MIESAIKTHQRKSSVQKQKQKQKKQILYNVNGTTRSASVSSA
jgi:hypothetical protein